jgi:hypothetical protein
MRRSPRASCLGALVLFAAVSAASAQVKDDPHPSQGSHPDPHGPYDDASIEKRLESASMPSGASDLVPVAPDKRLAPQSDGNSGPATCPSRKTLSSSV